MAELSRRGLFTGNWRNAAPDIRPPWIREESRFQATCTRCDACVKACPDSVLRRGAGGYPEINFSQGECTFCYACASACPESLFLPRESLPWSLVPNINQQCLAWHRVECRSCQDTCDAQAITFRPVLQGIARPQLNAESCSGCGACIAGCPVSAISLRSSYAN